MKYVVHKQQQPQPQQQQQWQQKATARLKNAVRQNVDCFDVSTRQQTASTTTIKNANSLCNSTTNNLNSNNNNNNNDRIHKCRLTVCQNADYFVVRASQTMSIATATATAITTATTTTTRFINTDSPCVRMLTFLMFRQDNKQHQQKHLEMPIHCVTAPQTMSTATATTAATTTTTTRFINADSPCVRMLIVSLWKQRSDLMHPIQFVAGR